VKTILCLVVVACSSPPTTTSPDAANSPPPCVSTTGSTCHAAEVVAWTTCARRERCDGISHAAALVCQVDEMVAICLSTPCPSNDQYPKWTALDACQLAANQASCSGPAVQCGL